MAETVKVAHVNMWLKIKVLFHLVRLFKSLDKVKDIIFLIPFIHFRKDGTKKPKFT